MGLEEGQRDPELLLPLQLFLPAASGMCLADLKLHIWAWITLTPHATAALPGH